MSDHIVASFDSELALLAGNVAEMGGLAEQIVRDAVDALVHFDSGKAREVVQLDDRLDALHHALEERVILLIARRQPVARDLRAIIAALRISHDLERVGDLAKNIAKRVSVIETQLHAQKLTRGVEHLAELAQTQLKAVLDAYVARDAQAAMMARAGDDEVDRLYTSLFRELLTYMMEDPRNISVCTHLLFSAKNIERIGDHATNIAENIYYLVTGTTAAQERPKADETPCYAATGEAANKTS